MVCLVSHQIKGWGDASMSLCARVVAEVQSLCQSSFRGVELQAPTAMCCTGGCDNTLGTLHDLASAALRGGDAHAVTTCAHGHATRLQPFVGMLPGAEDAHAAQLLYWLRIVQDHLRRESSAAVGIDDDASSCDDTASLSMFTSLTTALVRWAAHSFHEAGTPSSHCPRVWVPVRHDNNGSTLVLRPVCEHAECLHAVRTQSRRGTDDVTSLVATRDGHRHAGVDGSHVSTVPLRTLAERSGRVLAALTQATSYGDEELLTFPASSISAAVDALLTALPPDAQASIQRLSDLHKALRKPLRWVQVVAQRHRADALSHRWLCTHHAKDTELARLRERQHEIFEAVSMLVEWSWHDGQRSCVFDRLCTATLEQAFQSKCTEVKLHCSDHTQTVQFLPSGMVMKESGARVGRVSLKTYACGCSVCLIASMRCLSVCAFRCIRIQCVGADERLQTPVSSTLARAVI